MSLPEAGAAGSVAYFFAGWDPILRIVVVGTLAYAALIVLQRLSGKRSLGRMNAFDFLITVALGSSFGRIMTARDVALAEAVTAFATLVLLHVTVSWLRERFPSFDWAVTPPPSLLYYRGRVLRHVLHREYMTETDLHTAVRKHGLGALDQAEAILLEPDGSVSVIRHGSGGDLSAIPHVNESAATRPDPDPSLTPRGRTAD